MELKIFKCMHCGNIVEKVFDRGVPVICCGEPMKEMKAGETDGATEKHVPVAAVEGNVVRVKVGDVAHPMTEEHHIAYIWLVTDKGVHRANLDHTGAPEAVFALADGEKAEAVYEYCNLHGHKKRAALQPAFCCFRYLCLIFQCFSLLFTNPTQTGCILSFIFSEPH